MTETTARIVFLPSGRRGEFPVGTPVLEAARRLGVDVDSVCGGRAMCGRCQVVCAEGDFPKHGIRSGADRLSQVEPSENKYAQLRGLAADRRLSCQARILGDLVIDVPPESQVHRQVVRKAADHRAITLDASVHLYFVEVAEADMHDPRGDVQRVLEALERDWQLTGLKCSHAVLPALQKTLRDGDWKITVAVNRGTQIVAAWPGLKADMFGLAIDIGSTTIAAHLCSLVSGDVVASDGIMNPQIRFGEDLMSRVSYVMMHPEGAVEMTRLVRDGVNRLIEQVTAAAGVDRDDVLDVTIAGNPIMHHLFLGISPVELGGAPFALATDAAVEVSAEDVGLKINNGAQVYVLPCIAGHVGADCAAAVLSEELHLVDETTLLVDVGTNAEIVLGNRHGLSACSSPTGPAFEGAQISGGQRAAPGAIERVRIDRTTLEPRYRVIGSQLWSDDPGFADSVAAFGVTGICGSGIIEVVAEMFLAGIVSEDGVVDGDLAARSPRIVASERTFSYLLHDGENRIAVTQNDVRQIQLAKAALYAGIRLLMDRAGIASVDRIRLAGAFGSHIDPTHAMVLGLVPDCAADTIASAGNAAGSGARIALLNCEARREIERVVRTIDKIETAVEPRFQQYFVDAMAFPHKTDPFEKLFSVVTRPPRKLSAAADGGNGRRRRRHRKRTDAVDSPPETEA